MNTIREFFAHPLIQMACVLGATTVIMAHFSKHVLSEPIPDWQLALPAFLAALFQGFAVKRPSSPIGRVRIGVLVIVLPAFLVIVLNVR